MVEEAPRIHRLTVQDYHRMGEVGILAPECRTELLDGVIYLKTPITPVHAGSTDELSQWFHDHLHGRAYTTNQTPLALADDSEPVPDAMLCRRDNYRHRHPSPVDVFLIVEVTDTTTTYDLQRKALRYAQAGIPEYWVYLVQAPELIVHRNPAADGYKLLARHAPGEPVAPLAFPDVSFDLAVLLD